MSVNATSFSRIDSHESSMRIRFDSDRIVILSCDYQPHSGGFGYIHLDDAPAARPAPELIALVARIWCRGGRLLASDAVWECRRPGSTERSILSADYQPGDWQMPGFGASVYAWVFAGLSHQQVAEIGGGSIPALNR